LTRLAPTALVVAAALAAWLLTGVGLGDAALFGAHELGFVLLPGAIVYAALRSKRPGWLPLTAVGYAVGSVLEILAFALTAALHIRGALWAYPPVAVVAGLLVLRRRGALTADRGPPASVRGDRFAWALGALCVAAIAYIAVAYFLFEPLPQRAGSVVYVPDLVFHLGVAADALHHWPISDPKAAGVSLPYENFIYMKLAATSQLTHIPLPTLLFRLYVLPPVVAIVALLACAGSAFTGRRGVGLLAATLFVFVGQLGLDPHHALVFSNTVFFSLTDSPSYVLGLVTWLAALIVLHEQLSAGAAARGWVLLALLLIGCAGAKAAILPVLLGGLVLYLVAVRARDRAALWALLLTAVIFVATYVLIYHGGRGGLRLELPGTVRTMDVVQYAEAKLAGKIGHPLFWVGATVVGLFGFAGGTLAGLPGALASPELRRARTTLLLLALLVASFVPFLLLTHKGGSENFFTYYGLTAGAIVSAWGLVALSDRMRPLAALRRRQLALGGGAWLIVLLAAALLPYAISRHPPMGTLYALWILLPVAVAAVLLVLGTRSAGRARATLFVCAVGAVALVGLLDTPLHTGWTLGSRLRSAPHLYVSDSAQLHGLTPGLQRALAWVRRHTPTRAVIAVNNQFSAPARQSPDYYYYSAFGERRIFLEGWVNTIPAAAERDPAVTPFPERLRLNDAVFGAGDSNALAEMVRRYGVRYLLVDRGHGPASDRLAALGRVVFSNSAAIVYAVG
jgi:hypothetical protein